MQRASSFLFLNFTMYTLTNVVEAFQLLLHYNTARMSSNFEGPTPKVQTLNEKGVQLQAMAGSRVSCVGAGYVGGPTMAMLALKNPDVTFTVVDSWKERIMAWKSDNLPIYEPGLDAIVRQVRDKNLFFVWEQEDIRRTLSESDIIFVSVNTPTKSFGMGKGAASNVKNVELVGRLIASACINKSTIVVEKSTVPCKTAETLRRILDANGAKGLHHAILSNPEFLAGKFGRHSTCILPQPACYPGHLIYCKLAEGTAMRDLENPSRVLIGGEADPVSQAAVSKLCSLYYAGGRWVPKERLITTNLWSSELSKLVANAFLAQRISSINSISALCEVTDADVNEVAKAIGTDPRIGPQFLAASVGFGGSCFKKDVLNLVYLCQSYGLSEVADYWQGVVDMNEWQMNRFARTVLSRLFNNVTGKKLAMLGFAFKKDTGDVRESAAAYVARGLLEERAQIAVYDPKVSLVSMMEEMDYTCGVNKDTLPEIQQLLTMEQDAYTACKGAHAVMILTEWPDFQRLDWARIYEGMLKPAFIFDGRNILNHAELRHIGFDVYAIGKPLRHAGAGPVFAGPIMSVSSPVDVTAPMGKAGHHGGAGGKVVSTH